MTEEILKDYLHISARYDRAELDCMSGYEKMDAYLKHIGIIDYTDEIICLVKAIGIENL